MRAACFVAVGEPLRIVEIDQPVAGPGEALIAVRAVGLCGSDVHVVEGHTPTAYRPITLGHEIAGEVVQADGGTIRAGARVFVNPMTGCGACRSCAAGEVNYCPQRRILGLQLEGGLAEYVVAPTANLTVLPDPLEFSEIAMIESAATSSHALRVLEADTGDVIAVIGAGGLGMQAIRLAVAQGARVVAVDPDPRARMRALDAGASGAFEPLDDVVERIRVHAGMPGGIDGAIDCVGIQATFETALDVVRPHGHVALVGIGAVPLSLTPPAHFMRRALRVSAIYGYTAADVADVASRLADGTVDLRASVSAVLPLDEVNDGLRLFADRKQPVVRVVIEPHR